MITTSIVLDHRNRAHDVHAPAPIEVRINYLGKLQYVNTGIRVSRENFVGGSIVNQHDAPELNKRLSIIYARVQEAVNNALEDGRAIDMTRLRADVWRLSNTIDIPAWIEEQLEKMDLRPGTAAHYRTLILRLREYGKLNTWQDATVETLYDWDAWLRELRTEPSRADRLAGYGGKPLSTATIGNYHKKLSAMLYRAERLGVLDKSPYRMMRGQFRRPEREETKFLTEEEMHLMERLHPVAGTDFAVARDLFIFQMYTGLSYSDAQAFDITQYRQIGGEWCMVGERVKTGVPFVNQLLPPAVEVLKKYGWKVPKIGNAKYNQVLKTLGVVAGILTPLHSHIARHTFATFMLRNGVKIENLAKMLGHTNIKQTQRYAKVLAESVHEDFRLIAEKLRGQNE